MNTPLDRSHSAKLCLIIITWLLVCPGLVGAAELKEARVTQVVKDVKLLPETAAPRPAAVNDPVRNGTAVRTGVESRTELTFTDQTLARLGANTIFSFAEGTRNLELKDGAMLLRVPKGAGGAKINTAAISAAITGTTVMIETHPVTTKTKGGFYKFIVLEGTARLFLPGRMGESVLVHAGQMIIMQPDGKKIPNPVDVDIGKIMQSSLLITGFAPLPSAPLIALQEQQQNTLKSSGQLYDTNLVIFGGGTGVSVTDPTNTNAVSVATTAQSPSSSPPPTPPPASKFGALSVITSPDPFVINSGTTIQTDPTITANGQTYFGKIWRGPSIDGPLSVYAFGSTSAFDSASGFDTRVIGNTNGAGFKFNSLQLTGNPTVSTTNGAIHLGLFAINGITSGAPGGTLTFAGIRGLLLATQNGPIDLGSEISFSGLHDLILYARGANSDLTFSSAISGVTNTTLIAQRDVNIDGTTLDSQTLQVIAGSNISIGVNAPVTLNTGTTSLLVDASAIGNVNNGGDITLKSAQDLTTNGALSLLIANDGGHIGTGGNISVTTGGDLTTSGDATFTIQNTTGMINDGGNLALITGGSISSAGAFSLLVENYDETAHAAGQIGAGGDIFLSTGGDLTADSMSVGINNRGGGRIGSSANLTINIGGALTTLHNGKDFLMLPASLSIDLATRFDNLFGVGNTAASFIGGDATLLFHSDSASIGGIATVTVSNRGGTIGGNALLKFDVTHDLKIFGDGVFELLNGGAGGSPFGGNIHGSATIQLSADNMTLTAGSLFVFMDNANGGRIGSNATVSLNLPGDLAVQGDTTFKIQNFMFGSGFPAPSIGQSATINVTAANITTGGNLDVEIDNSGGGTIGGNATINMNISGTAKVATDATFQIKGSDSAASAAINFNGGTYNVGTVNAPGTFLGFIDGNGTMTFNNATINADTVKGGVFGTNGTLRIGGGSISANTLLHLYATGSNGLIDFVSNVTLNSVGAAAVIAANTVTVENGVVVTIARSTPANVFTNVPNYSGSGGNGSTSGIFGGAGATTQPLGGQPPFVVAAATTRSANKASASSRSTAGLRVPVLHVSDTSELASLLDHAALGGDGKARMPSGSRNPNASVQPAGQSPAPRNSAFGSGDTRPKPTLLAVRVP